MIPGRARRSSPPPRRRAGSARSTCWSGPPWRTTEGSPAPVCLTSSSSSCSTRPSPPSIRPTPRRWRGSSPSGPRSWSTPPSTSCGWRPPDRRSSCSIAATTRSSCRRMASALAFGLWGPGTLELRRELAARAGSCDRGDRRPDPRVHDPPRRVLRRRRVRRRRPGRDEPRADQGHRRRDRRAPPALDLRRLRGVRGHDGGSARRRRAAQRAHARDRHRDRRAGRVRAVRGAAVREPFVRRSLRRGDPPPRGCDRGDAGRDGVPGRPRHQLLGVGPRGRGPRLPARRARVGLRHASRSTGRG